MSSHNVRGIGFGAGDDEEDDMVLGQRGSIQKKYQEASKGGAVDAATNPSADANEDGTIDAGEFYASEVEIANCNNGPAAYFAKWSKEVIDLSQPGHIYGDLLTGITVGVAQIPEALAFALLAGVPTISGLYAVFILGLTTALFGGRPAMISGATGALAVVYPRLLDSVNNDVEYLYAALIVMGIFQIIFAMLGWPRFVTIIPEPVMVGFVNGLAIVIGYAQLGAFQLPSNSTDHRRLLSIVKDVSTGYEGKNWVSGDTLYIMVMEMCIAVFIIFAWPKVPKVGKILPPPLVAIVFVTAISHIFSLDTRTIEDAGDVSGSFPTFKVPDVDWGDSEIWFETLIPQSLIFATVGLVETLMTLQLIDKLTETKGNGQAEAAAQGVGNLLCGFFGAMGGCVTIGQSQLNVKMGARGRLSGIIAAVGVLLTVLVAYKLINLIPVASLVGVMVVLVINMFDWNSLRYMRRLPPAEGFVIVLVTVVTILTDNLAIAVAAGVIVTCITYCWNDGFTLNIGAAEKLQGPQGQEIALYIPRGRLYFSSRKKFEDTVKPEMDPRDVTISFKDCRWDDFTALCCLAELVNVYRNKDKMVWLTDVDAGSLQVMRDAGTTTELFTEGAVLPTAPSSDPESQDTLQQHIAGCEQESSYSRLHKSTSGDLTCAATGKPIAAGEVVVAISSKLDMGISGGRTCFYTNFYTLATKEAQDVLAKLDLDNLKPGARGQAGVPCSDKATGLIDMMACINLDAADDSNKFLPTMRVGGAHKLKRKDRLKLKAALEAGPDAPVDASSEEAPGAEVSPEEVEVPLGDLSQRACGGAKIDRLC